MRMADPFYGALIDGLWALLFAMAWWLGREKETKAP